MLYIYIFINSIGKAIFLRAKAAKELQSRWSSHRRGTQRPITVTLHAEVPRVVPNWRHQWCSCRGLTWTSWGTTTTMMTTTTTTTATAILSFATWLCMTFYSIKMCTQFWLFAICQWEAKGFQSSCPLRRSPFDARKPVFHGVSATNLLIHPLSLETLKFAADPCGFCVLDLSIRSYNFSYHRASEGGRHESSPESSHWRSWSVDSTLFPGVMKYDTNPHALRCLREIPQFHSWLITLFLQFCHFFPKKKWMAHFMTFMTPRHK